MIFPKKIRSWFYLSDFFQKFVNYSEIQNFFHTNFSTEVEKSMSQSNSYEKSSEDILMPPSNFSMVDVGIYRGSYPTFKNFSFLQHLKIKTILFLCPEEYSPTNTDFLKKNGMQLISIPMAGNREPITIIPTDLMNEALYTIADSRNHPIYIHCNKGKHRTGTVIGCLRKLQLWTMSAIFEEYRRFAGNKARALDQQYIELYEPPDKIFQSEFLPNCLSHLQ